MNNKQLIKQLLGAIFVNLLNNFGAISKILLFMKKNQAMNLVIL